MGTFKREYCIQQKRYKSVEKSTEKIQEKKTRKMLSGQLHWEKVTPGQG